MSYNPGNLKLQPYDHAAVIELADHAAQLGITFHIGGIPFGAPFNRDLWSKHHAEEGAPAIRNDWAETQETPLRGAVVGTLRGSG
jgi:hypothetical protein